MSKKKILLITDDIRAGSGVAHVGRDVVVETSPTFDWVQMAGSIKHPDSGKIINGKDLLKSWGGDVDATLTLYPQDGYGNHQALREILDIEKPDAILLITDPRYFTWLFSIANEIKAKGVKIAYLSIWDNYPVPYYNLPYYESCDLLMAINKQTDYFHKEILKNSPYKKDKIFKYVPHGVDHKIFYPLNENDEKLIRFKMQLFGLVKPEFVVGFNSRNIHRKQIPLLIRGFADFLNDHDGDWRKVFLILKTEVVSDSGTDLFEVVKLYLGEKSSQVIFLDRYLKEEELNMFYNTCDVQALLSSNEGWGLSLTESTLAGTPFMATFTGGMKDQMGFKYDFWEYNYKTKYETSGDWAFPIEKTVEVFKGAPPTPYIYDDVISYEDIFSTLKHVYDIKINETNPKFTLKGRGLQGREWMIEQGFTKETQGKRIIEAINELLEKEINTPKWEIVNVIN